MFDWNDLRYFLAVAREGSTIAAGKMLRVSQSTVQRRLTELERQIGRELFSRTQSGYRLTDFGKALLPHAERIENAVQDFSGHVSSATRDTAGIIRVTCPEPIVNRLTPLVERFHARHPNLRVEFVMSDRYVDLSQGDADVAFRSGDTDEELVGRKIADSVWAIYAAKAYVERHGQPETLADLTSHAMVCFDETMSNHRVSKWMKESLPNARIVARNNSVLGLMLAVKSGIAIGPLPTAIADGETDLIRILGPIPELARSWRILTRPELRKTARISALFDFIAEERDALKGIFTG